MIIENYVRLQISTSFNLSGFHCRYSREDAKRGIILIRMQRFSEEKDISFSDEQSRSRSKIRSRLIILSVVVFVLLIILVVFITLYALEKSKGPKGSKPAVPSSSPAGGEQKYCGTRACFETSKGKLIFKLLMYKT